LPDGAVLTSIRLDEPVSHWTSAGFLQVDGNIRLGGVLLSFDASLPPSLGFDRDVGDSFAGIETHVSPPTAGPPPRHPNGVDGFDHVVIMSGDLDATLADLDPEHFEVRRIRDTTMAGAEVAQAFIVAGTAVIEIVGPRSEPTGSEPATLWGLAATATRFDDCAEYWGGACSAPRAAVQPGRRIVSLSSPTWTSRYPLAVMSPRSVAPADG
jgi:hypothetical protein